MDSAKKWSAGFEFLDIEVIPQSKENEETTKKWDCDNCSLYFLDELKLNEHKLRHNNTKEEAVRCQYCNKPLSIIESSKECYNNRKCETCEYKCSKCPKRFLRFSSLQNHEKNHISSNQKKTVLNNNKLVNGLDPTNKNMKVSKKRQSQLTDDTEEETVVEKGNFNNKSGIIPKKKIKIEPLENSSADEMMATNSNTTKRTSLRSCKLAQQDKPAIIENNKQNSKIADQEKLLTKVKSKQTTGGPSAHITPVKDNTVNYKPFSCHVCGDTFASDNSLLDHIRSHGENAAERFKCKHCGDEFDDIYKMQYHLAICPLAEDELECTFQKSIIPPRFIKKEPNSFSPPNNLYETTTTRKRGRPRKENNLISQNSVEETDDIHSSSINTSGGFRKNKTDTKHKNKVIKSLTPKKLRKKSLNRTVTEKDFSDGYYDDDSNEFTENPKSNEVIKLGDSFETIDDENKKGYVCPFPGCTIKCTREKALLCHMKNHEDFEESMKCHKCATPLDDVQSLRIHMNECKGYREDKDDDSNDDDYKERSYKFTNKQSTATNKFQRRRGGDFHCSICMKSYSTKQKLDRHLALHRSSNFTCRVCQDVFINQQLLDKHFSIKHPTKSPYHCAICQEDFISELFLQIHESDYHANLAGSNNPATVTTEDSYWNEMSENLCLKIKTQKRNSYTSSVGNNRHLRKNKRKSVCPICFVRFSDKESIRSHFRDSHVFKTNSRYICSLCETEKQNAEMLSYHLEVHSDNLLSVNRFSELRSIGVDRGSNKVSDQSFCLDVVKSEPISDKEEESEWDPEMEKKEKTGKRKSLRNKISKTDPSNNKITHISFKTEDDDVLSKTRVLRRHTSERFQKQQVDMYSKKSKNKEIVMESTEDDSYKLLESKFDDPIKRTHSSRSRKIIDVSGRKYKKRKHKGKSRFSKRKTNTKKSSMHNDSDSNDGGNEMKREIVQTNLNPEIPSIDSERLDLIKLGVLQTDENLGNGTSEINEDYCPGDDDADECITEAQEVSHKVAPDDAEILDDNALSVYNSPSATDKDADENEAIDKVQSVVASETEKDTKQSVSEEQKAEDDVIFSSSDEDEPSEKICCTMCSLSFYNQDDLLDHVTSHI